MSSNVLAARRPSLALPEGWVRDTRLGWWLNLLLGLSFVITLTPDAFNFSTLDQPGGLKEGYGFIARVQWFPLFAIGALITVWRRKLAWQLLKATNPFLILLLVWIFISVLWSGPHQDVSLRRAVKILGMGLVVFSYFLADWTPMGAIRVLRNACALMVFASIIFVLVQPQYGIHQGLAEPNLKGAWRGVTTHKNALGILCSMAAILWAHAWVVRDAAPLRCVLVLAAVIVCLLGSKSTTGLVTSVSSGGLVFYLLSAPPALRSPAFILGALSLVVSLLCLVFIFTGIPTLSELLGAATGGVGKDAGFTGRDLIWGAVLDEVAKHPWIGTGYNAFWISTDLSSPSADIIRTIKFAPLQAHNGYLEILNELGIIGLVMLAGFLAYQFWQLSKLYLLDRRVAAFGIAYLAYDMLLNISEANFLRPTFAPSLVEWVVVIATARSMLHHQWMAEQRVPGTAQG